MIKKLLKYSQIFLLIAGSALLPKLANASTVVGTDGAVAINVDWEAKKRSSWFIEYQRYGTQLIENAIQVEDDKAIRTGILCLDWGFAKQGSDGSFPGTGDPFHSTSLFVESAARAVYLLKNYSPSTYTKDSTYYNGKISTYTSKLKLAGKWFMDPAVYVPGKKNDSPYTHRRYILASLLGQIGQLVSDSGMVTAAAAYATEGISLQMHSGTEQITYPNGNVVTVDMNGVDPELGGFDVNYQDAGLLFAQRYLPYCKDSTLASNLKQTLALGMNWLINRTDNAGNIDITGSTRVGIEKNPDGTVKLLNTTEVEQCFNAAAVNLNDTRYKVAYIRMTQGLGTGFSPAIAASGAAGSNIPWENGTASSWSLSQQKAGADWISNGIALENDPMIQEGLLIFNWGFSKQLSDGSFGTTTSSFLATAQFMEAVARSCQMLNNYHPVLDTASEGIYNSTVSTYLTHLASAASWITRSDISTNGIRTSAPYTSRFYAVAAALAETGSLLNKSSLRTAADKYITIALPMQFTSGINPENGVSDVNTQALGLRYAERYFSSATNSALKTTLSVMLTKGLTWENQWVDASGNIKGTSSPDRVWLSDCFNLSYNIIGVKSYLIVVNRLNNSNN